MASVRPLESFGGEAFPIGLEHATSAAEKDRFTHEADFALRQAWALCPYSTEAVFQYVAFLMEQNRIADGLVVAETAAQMPSMGGQEGRSIRDLVEELKKQASSGGK